MTAPVGDVFARMSPICGLCLLAFREGDQVKAIYRTQRGITPSVTVHRACYGQLEPGDVTMVFQALDNRLSLPLKALRSMRAAGLL